MYIPIKPEFIGSFSRQIIKFLIDEKIISDCKVANTYRSDSLIINVLSEQDAQKIVDFIMDSGLKEALGIHHPFIPDYEGIGVIGGHDKENSYTGRISDALFKFVSECKRHNQYNMINFDTFLLTLEESLKAGRVSNYLSIEQIIKNLKKIKLAHLEKEKNKNLASIN